MRRRRLVVLALVASAGSLVACDGGDGRRMREPSDYQVWRLQNTTPTTSSTTTTLPPETSPPLPTTIPAGHVTEVAAPNLEPPDLGAAGMAFSGPWADGAAIGASFTCDGDDVSPQLTWTAPPDGTAELALAVTDDDANDWVHWIVVGLPPAAGSIGGGAPLADATEGTNDFGNPGWGGPCPPPVSGEHTYRFTLFALAQQLELPADSPNGDLLTAIEAAALGATSFTGTYTRQR